MKSFVFVMFWACAITWGYAQTTARVYAFYEYVLKNGMEDEFLAGYQRDLEWHKSKGDDWAWVGWFVMNGERRGRFIDATPDHKWSDFDSWKVNGAENARFNKIHWTPYVEFSSGSYQVLLDEFSSFGREWYKSKYLQVFTFELLPGRETVFSDYLREFKLLAKLHAGAIQAVWMRTASGGGVEEYHLLICMDSIASMDVCIDLFRQENWPKTMKANYIAAVAASSSEFWSYRETLSLYPDKR
ncbi:MAG TPA: hypothetical protein VFE50_15895 [Cyclobacteriaceae bacterium]|nr:hypothetical protein [Cyclobacteriaceae bacterium]